MKTLKQKWSVLKILLFIIYVQGCQFCRAQIVYLPFSDTTIRAYDLTTNAILATIPVSTPPKQIIPHPDGTKIYLIQQNGIQIVDILSQTSLTNVNIVGTSPQACISHDGQFLYLLNYTTELNLYRLNTQTNVVSLITSFPNEYFTDFCISKNDDKLYFVNATHAFEFTVAGATISSTISLLSPSTMGASYCCLNGSGSMLYVLGEGGHINMINTSNYMVDTSCTLYCLGCSLSGPPKCIRFNSANQTLIVGFNGGLRVYNTISNHIEQTIVFSPYHEPVALELNEDGTQCYSYGWQNGNIYGWRAINTTNYFIEPATFINPYTLFQYTENLLVKRYPEIDIQVGPPVQSIVDGDNTPSLADKTDFGNVNTTGYSSQTFKILNNGMETLHISSMNLTGADASQFTINTTSMNIAVGGMDSFTVYFYPSSPGLKSAVLNIDNNDFDEGIYDFAIQGTGTQPKYVYTTQAAANTVGVVDRNTNQHVMDITVGSYPNGMCFNPSKTRLYVTNSNSNDVSVINTLTNTVQQTIPVGNYPVGICASPNGNKLYVANQNSNSVSVVNVNTLSVDATIPVGNQPFGICNSLDGLKVYVTNNGSNTVSVINTSTNAVVSTLNVGQAPKGITINPAGTIVYVANSGSNNVSSFHVSNNSMNPNLSVGTSPYSICFNATGTKYYVSNYNDFTVTSVPIAGGFPQTIAVGNYPAGMSLSEDGTQLWVTNYGSDNLTVINSSTNSVANTINIGSGPISFGSAVATVGVPEIKVKGGTLPLLVSIENYDYTPSILDHTDMGLVSAGNSQTITIYIQNSGSGDLVINTIDQYGPDTAMFELTEVPVVIPVNGMDSFKISFTPLSSGIKSGYIHIATNVPNLQNFYFGIQAEGVGIFDFSGQLKVFLEGYYVGGLMMLPVLINQNSPAATLTQTDFADVELYQPYFPYELVHTSSGVLHTDGLFTCVFPVTLLENEYYLAVKHRNSIETWSANPVFLSNQFFYDFTTAASKAFGNNQQVIASGVFALYSGDINQDGVVDGLDYNDWETDNNNFGTGYLATDLNGDGIVDGLDFLFWELNNNNFVGTIKP